MERLLEYTLSIDNISFTIGELEDIRSVLKLQLERGYKAYINIPNYVNAE